MKSLKRKNTYQLGNFSSLSQHIKEVKRLADDFIIHFLIPAFFTQKKTLSQGLFLFAILS